jgi:Chalcone isomerase-like
MQLLPLSRSIRACVAGVVFFITSSAGAATIAEQNFSDRIRLGSSDLVLNGVGVRAVAWLKGYAAGLYLTQKANTAAQVLAAQGPKRMQMKMLVDVEAKEFVKAFDKGMARNHTPAEQEALRERGQQFNRSVNALGALKPGDVIDLDFVPPRGFVLSVNGVARGGAIPGEDFYAGLLKIFIGERPVDTQLKAGLLGAP